MYQTKISYTSEKQIIVLLTKWFMNFSHGISVNLGI